MAFAILAGMTQTSSNFPDCFYRVTIKGACVRDGKLLLVRESVSHSGQKWELPGGGLDFGEDIQAALVREVREETGLTVTRVSPAPIYAWTSKSEHKRGLDWFYSCVLVYQVEFENLDITPSDECEVVDFFDMSQLQAVRVSGQLARLKEVFNPADFVDGF